jgi:hypothetical protein
LRYERLRAEYDAAFDRLRAEVCRLRSITPQRPPDPTAGEAARDRVDQALAVYRECRNRLADFLTLTATGPNQGALGHRDEVQVLAYRLWEEAGRPIGNPEEDWHRAEGLLGSRQ